MRWTCFREQLVWALILSLSRYSWWNSYLAYNGRLDKLWSCIMNWIWQFEPLCKCVFANGTWQTLHSLVLKKAAAIANMEDPKNVFGYQHQLCLTSESSIELCRRVKEFLVKENKLWLFFVEELTGEVFLDVLDQLLVLIKRSQIEYFWYNAGHPDLSSLNRSCPSGCIGNVVCLNWW